MNRFISIIFCLFLMGCTNPPTERQPLTPTTKVEATGVETTDVETAVPSPTPPLPTATQTPLPTPDVTPTPEPQFATYPTEVVQWVNNHAIAFDTALPGNGCDDLQQLLQMVGDARVVALGEATHGTSEFFTMRHRLVECLVQEKRFTHFVIEASLPESYHVNDYIQDQIGTGSDVVEGMLFWIWNTDEMLAMVEWMHSYNMTAETPITFHGFDMQFAQMAVNEFTDYLDTVDLELAEEINVELHCLQNNLPLPKYVRMGDDFHLSCRESLKKAETLFLAAEVRLTQQSSPAQFDYAHRLIQVILQSEQLATFTGDPSAQFYLRDKAMADNVLLLLEQLEPNEKLILWGHNAHIQEVAVTASNDPSEGESSQYVMMGTHLSEALGSDYVSIGFSFSEGTFSTRSNGLFTAMSMDGSLENSYEPLFSQVGAERFYLDLQAIAEAEPMVTSWFAENHWFRAIGASYEPNKLEQHSFYMPLSNAFDILIYFEETTATQLR